MTGVRPERASLAVADRRIFQQKTAIRGTAFGSVNFQANLGFSTRFFVNPNEISGLLDDSSTEIRVLRYDLGFG
jgi:hypothetical protein